MVLSATMMLSNVIDRKIVSSLKLLLLFLLDRFLVILHSRDFNKHEGENKNESMVRSSILFLFGVTQSRKFHM